MIWSDTSIQAIRCVRITTPCFSDLYLTNTPRGRAVKHCSRNYMYLLRVVGNKWKDGRLKANSNHAHTYSGPSFSEERSLVSLFLFLPCSVLQQYSVRKERNLYNQTCQQQETRGNQCGMFTQHSWRRRGVGGGASSASSPRRCWQAKDLPHLSRTTAFGSAVTLLTFSSPKANTRPMTMPTTHILNFLYLANQTRYSSYLSS